MNEFCKVRKDDCLKYAVGAIAKGSENGELKAQIGTILISEINYIFDAKQKGNKREWTRKVNEIRHKTFSTTFGYYELFNGKQNTSNR